MTAAAAATAMSLSTANRNHHIIRRATATDQPVLHAGNSCRPPSTSLINLPSAVSNLLHLHLSATKDPIITLPVINHDTPTFSPKDDISSLRSSIHGTGDWSPLLNPLHPSLRREILKYGELAQATYDAFDTNPASEFHGSCLYSRRRLLHLLGLSHHGYQVTNYLYATSHLDLPHWLPRRLLPSTWSTDSNWMGFVAVSGDVESHRIGRRDIAVAWRGTVSPAEWMEDLQGQLQPLPGAPNGDDVRVERGFLSIYTSRSRTSRYTGSSASEQVISELLRLVELYRQKGEEVSVTITGHSLGGALALLNAAEAAASLPSSVAVKVISFGAPRVGNEAFGEVMLRRKGVKVLRVATKQDVVPKVPGVFINDGTMRRGWEWVYAHVGDLLELDAVASPYLKRGVADLAGFHGLETYLHLVDGYDRAGGGFRAGAKRDVALVNKATGMLRQELRIPACWHQPENKGMVRNQFGRWVMPCRDPEDIPSVSVADDESTDNDGAAAAAAADKCAVVDSFS